MGIDVFALVADWAPTVAAYREAGGSGFYWDYDDQPYFTEHRLPGGKAFLEAGQYYDLLRPHLPERLRQPADAVFGQVLPCAVVYDWTAEDRDDLAADAGLDGSGDVIYAFRPDTAAAVARLPVPWEELAAAAEEHPVPGEHLAPAGTRAGMWQVVDWDSFHWHASAHLAAVTDAVQAGRGLVTMVSI
ncbi:hypothetical protein [Amycolatopsis sp. NPDC004079]|uniref:hypothetical protein n=1 Tax=Amycolatopsis sp. NPDC004079 TaxID=3154549 RepID=UPI0033B26FB9